MRYVGLLSAQLLDYLEPFIKTGITTLEIDELAGKWIIDKGATSACLGYNEFPRNLCTSINEVVCHGIPEKRILRDGDIVNVDVTLIYDGFHGDTSRMFCIGKVDSAASLLVQRTQKALSIGIDTIKNGSWLGNIGSAIEHYIKPFGYSIVTAFGGHGIGREFHEAPFVSHHKQNSKGTRLETGMIFTVEPMINIGTPDVYIDDKDGWTVYTEDHKLSAQFEHTVLVTDDGVEILTLS